MYADWGADEGVWRNVEDISFAELVGVETAPDAQSETMIHDANRDEERAAKPLYRYTGTGPNHKHVKITD